MDNRAQLSLELIIVAFAIVALALFLFTNLKGTAENYDAALKDKADTLVEKIKAW